MGNCDPSSFCFGCSIPCHILMKKLNDSSIVFLTVFLAVLIGGAGPVFGKLALKDTSPVMLTFLRFLVSSIVFLPFFIVSHPKFNKNFIKLIAVSLFATGNVLLFILGLKLTTASIAQVLQILIPVTVALLSFFILKERINSRKVLGILLGIIGAVIIILLPIIERGVFSGNLQGNLLVMGGIILFSFYVVLSKKLHLHFSPLQIAMVFSFTTLLIMLPLSVNEAMVRKMAIFSFSPFTGFAILYLGIANTVIYYVIQQYAIKHGSPLAASTISYLQPISTVIWAGIFLGEKLTIGIALGSIIAFLGTYFIIQSSRSK